MMARMTSRRGRWNLPNPERGLHAPRPATKKAADVAVRGLPGCSLDTGPYFFARWLRFLLYPKYTSRPIAAQPRNISSV
jgi:hypothetical protein